MCCPKRKRKRKRYTFYRMITGITRFTCPSTLLEYVYVAIHLSLQCVSVGECPRPRSHDTLKLERGRRVGPEGDRRVAGTARRPRECGRAVARSTRVLHGGNQRRALPDGGAPLRRTQLAELVCETRHHPWRARGAGSQ